MQTLIIYDSEGFIISQMSGNVREPIGIPFMWVEIPEGHYAKEVDVTTEPHTAIFRKHGEFDYENATLEEVKTYRIALSKKNLEKFLKDNPVLSTIHKPEGAFYSVTDEKQRYLQGEIALTQLNASAGIPYQPSWNETGKGCTYDWTIEQLSMLAIEMGVHVKPRVSKQQSIEEDISFCTTKDDVMAIDVSVSAYESI